MTTALARNCADAFFHASAAGDEDGMRAATAPGAVFWQNVDGHERTIDQVVRFTRRLRADGSGFAYTDVRRLLAADGFCEQHTVVFRAADGSVTAEHAVCVVGRVDADGRLTRLDEYLAGSPA